MDNSISLSKLFVADFLFFEPELVRATESEDEAALLETGDDKHGNDLAAIRAPR